MSPRSRRSLVVPAGLLVAASVTLVGPAPASWAADAFCNPSLLQDQPRQPDSTTRTNAPFERMNVAGAQRHADGSGVTVAVVDSGVEALAPSYDVVGRWEIPGLKKMKLSAHGTIVGGLIASDVGVAPKASLYDVRIYDRSPAEPGETGVESDNLAAGLRHVRAVAKQFNIRVVNVSLSVGGDDPDVAAAIKGLWADDIVVVAASGNRPTDRSDNFKGTPESDAVVFPADYAEEVLAVSAVAPFDQHPGQFVLPNAETDVAAPTQGARSYNITGQLCDIGDPATSWATAEVSGLAALLRQKYPSENAAQIVGRITATTEGGGPTPASGELPHNKWTGSGVVQMDDALTRLLQPGREGKVRGPEEEEPVGAPLPEPEVDLFGPARAKLLWAGLGGGSLMALAYILAPLVRRRRA